jgi:hypothetical protein
MDSIDFENQTFEISIPLNEIANHTHLITFMNRSSLSMENSQENQGHSKWIFKGGSSCLSAILEVQKHQHNEDMISIHWTCEALEVSFIRTGIFAELPEPST